MTGSEVQGRDMVRDSAGVSVYGVAFAIATSARAQALCSPVRSVRGKGVALYAGETMGQLGGERKGQAWWHCLCSGAGEPQSPALEPLGVLGGPAGGVGSAAQRRVITCCCLGARQPLAWQTSFQKADLGQDISFWASSDRSSGLWFVLQPFLAGEGGCRGQRDQFKRIINLQAGRP